MSLLFAAAAIFFLYPKGPSLGPDPAVILSGISWLLYQNRIFSPTDAMASFLGVLLLLFALRELLGWALSRFSLDWSCCHRISAAGKNPGCYPAVIALWLTVKTVNRAGERSGTCIAAKKEDRNDLLTGLFLLTVSLAWFLAATTFLAENGDGVMAYRYDNFLYGGSSSLLTVVKACILSPMKAIYECVDEEKLPFIAFTLLPLLGLPLFTRRYERYLLLIPYVLVNLMSDYPYQHDIFFQYTFGSAAFLLYLTLLNLADLKSGRKHVQRAGQNTIRNL